jgi:uncharacterized membrane protein
MLVSLPLGLLTLVPVWDGLAAFGWLHEATVVAYYTQLAGLLAAILAVFTGIADLVSLSEQPRLLALGLRHALLGVSAIATFAVAFAIRSPGVAPSLVVVVLDLAGAALLAAGGWAGGHLVFGFGTGVELQTETSRTNQRQD